MAAVLREVGRYDAADVRVLLHPDAARVVADINEVASKARADAARGEPSEILFYYSGHARAAAVNLGKEELSLGALRERLGALPTALTIVVLDACQSGAFTRVKGAEPAADFTYNSVAKLTQKGLAVMASSSSQELSQESDELRASYFTHHLVTALRGAGDVDHDGRVSLDEAYRYAYRSTLASTARTQVGEQHVTLETNLAGQGEVPVTYPADARAQLELPAPLDARVLVQHRPSGAVMADLQKGPGASVRLALTAGSYEAIVGQKSGIVECRLALTDDRVTTLDTSACAPIAPEKTAAKGEEPEAHAPMADANHMLRERDRWSVEASLGAILREYDAYTESLQNFGYGRSAGLFDLPTARITLGAARMLAPHVEGLVRLQTLSGDAYNRSMTGSTDSVSFGAYGGGIYVRASADVLGRWFGVYGLAGGGASLGRVTLETRQTGVPPSTTHTYWGYLLGGGVGLTARMPRLVTFFAEADYDRAPVIRDLIGNTHDSGGFSLALGVRVRFGEER
jgi:hypothetical protein